LIPHLTQNFEKYCLKRLVILHYYTTFAFTTANAHSIKLQVAPHSYAHLFIIKT